MVVVVVVVAVVVVVVVVVAVLVVVVAVVEVPVTVVVVVVAVVVVDVVKVVVSVSVVVVVVVVVVVLTQDKHCSGQTFRISGMTRHRKSGNSAHALGSLRPLQFASVVVTVVAVEVGPGACVVVVVLTQASHITGQISAMYLPAIMFEQRVEFKSGQISTGSGLPLHFSTHLLQRAGHRCWMARPAEPRVQSRSTNATRQSRNGSSSP
jgi:hypothetical protein